VVAADVLEEAAMSPRGTGARGPVGARQKRKPPLTRRQVTRRVLLWCSPVPIVVAFVFGVLMLGAGAGFRTAMDAYDEGDWSTAWLEFRDIRGNPVERWKGYYNAGTAALRDELYWSAVDDLGTALETVPDEYRCHVQTNRAIALEAYGDEQVADAQETIEGARVLLEAETARAAGEPYDETLFEPPYEGADEPSSAEELDWAAYLMHDARDQYAFAADAAAEPLCEQPPQPTPEPTPEPTPQASSGGGGEDPQEPQDSQDDAQEQEQQRLQDKMAQADELAQQTEALAREAAGEDPDEPGPQTEQERQDEIAERNRQAGGDGDEEGGGPDGDEPGTDGTDGDQPGGGRSGW
jgi:hypothetical protein